MYPRWPSKPLSREAYDEMRDLLTELKIIAMRLPKLAARRLRRYTEVYFVV